MADGGWTCIESCCTRRLLFCCTHESLGRLLPRRTRATGLLLPRALSDSTQPNASRRGGKHVTNIQAAAQTVNQADARLSSHAYAKMPLDTACLCGSCRIQVEGDPVFVIRCHCADCRAAGVKDYLHVAYFPADRVR